jgi:hypothetical protein
MNERIVIEPVGPETTGQRWRAIGPRSMGYANDTTQKSAKDLNPQKKKKENEQPTNYEEATNEKGTIERSRIGTFLKTNNR